MFKKILSVTLLLVLVVSSTAFAAIDNRDMQLQGGVLVSNSTDSFFFCPLEEGLSRRWGLYSLNTMENGPLVPIEDGYPARLVHADDERVYFFAYTDANRSTHALYSVTIASGAYEELLTNIKSAFVVDADTFYYVSADDAYTLCSFDIPTKKDQKVKDMSASEKTIYDAGMYNGGVFFITKDANGNEDGYEYHENTGKATNLDKPSPAAVTGLLYENYRIFAADNAGSQIYAQRIGAKSGERIGSNYNIGLTSPRFGEAIYAYDGDKNMLAALPLDGSSAKTLALEGSTMARLVLGGTKDELLLMNNEGVYAIKPDLSSQTRLFDFSQATGGQIWSHVLPAGSDAVAIFGYSVDTIASAGTLMPTGVYIVNRSTGEITFAYPDVAAGLGVSGGGEGGEGTTERPTMPESFGDIPSEEREEGETYFTFSSDN